MMLWGVFAALGGAPQHRVVLSAGVFGGLAALCGIFTALGGWRHQRILVVILVIAAVCGAALFLGLGGWKTLGSKAQDEVAIPADVTEIRVANLGLGNALLRRNPRPQLQIERTLHYLTPLVHRAEATYRVDGTVLYLNGGPFLTVVDYVVDVPDRWQMSGDLAHGGLLLTPPSLGC